MSSSTTTDSQTKCSLHYPDPSISTYTKTETTEQPDYNDRNTFALRNIFNSLRVRIIVITASIILITTLLYLLVPRIPEIELTYIDLAPVFTQWKIDPNKTVILPMNIHTRVSSSNFFPMDIEKLVIRVWAPTEEELVYIGGPSKWHPTYHVHTKNNIPIPPLGEGSATGIQIRSRGVTDIIMTGRIVFRKDKVPISTLHRLATHCITNSHFRLRYEAKVYLPLVSKIVIPIMTGFMMTPCPFARTKLKLNKGYLMLTSMPGLAWNLANSLWTEIWGG